MACILAEMPLPRPRLRPKTPQNPRDRRLRTLALLTLVLSAALVARLAVIRHTGYGSDLWLNTSWGYGGAQFGVEHSYDFTLNGAGSPNYPPMTLLVFTTVAHVYQDFFSPEFAIDDVAYRTLIKLPSVLADLGIVAMLFFLFRRTRNERWGVMAALAYALNPAAIVDGPLWGQTDSLHACAMLAALVCAGRNEWLVCGACAAAAMLLKAQSIVLLPVLGLLSLTGHERAGKMLIGAGVVTLITLLPFAAAGTLDRVRDVYVHSVGTYPWLAQGAYNFWLALFGGEVGRDDGILFLGVISYRNVGLLIFTATMLFTVLPYARSLTGEHRKPQTLLIVLLTGLVTQAFFLFNTEMHERYFFPFVALGTPLLLTGKRGIFLYWAANILGCLNLLGVLPVSPLDRAFFTELPNLPAFIGAAQTFVFVATVLHVRAVMAPELFRDMARDALGWLRRNVGAA